MSGFAVSKLSAGTYELVYPPGSFSGLTTPIPAVTPFAVNDIRAAISAGSIAGDGSMTIHVKTRNTSGVATDMTEQVIRDVALPTGLVDNKVCAIDDTWSGLRLVIRKELRK